MKILLINAEPSSSHTQKWLRFLVEAGHQIYFVSYHNRYKNTIQNVIEIAHFEAVNKNPFVFLKYILKIKNIVKRLNPDVVTCHYALGTPGLLAALSNFHPLLTIVWGGVDLYGPELSKFRYLIFNKLFLRLIFKKSDIIIVDCLDHKKYLITHGIPSEKIRVVEFLGLGVDFNIFNEKYDTKIIKKELRTENRFTAFCPRRIVPYTNIDIVIKAISVAKEKIPNILLVLINYAAEERYLAYINKLINEYKIQKDVILLDKVGQQKMPLLYCAADCVISISSFDGAPLTIAESMACRIPTISYSIPSIKEFVEEGKTGIIIQNLEAEELARAIYRLYADGELSKKIRQNGYDFIRKHADIEKGKEKLKSIYRELYEVNKPSKRRLDRSPA